MKSIQKLKMPSPALAYTWFHASSVGVESNDISLCRNGSHRPLVTIKTYKHFYQKGFSQ